MSECHPAGPAGAHLAAVLGDRCGCRSCLRAADARDATNWPILMGYMIVCLTCGDKRCPKAADHRESCSGS